MLPLYSNPPHPLTCTPFPPSCVVWLSEDRSEEEMGAVTSLTEIELDQITPVRVLHRRSLLSRTKVIHW